MGAGDPTNGEGFESAVAYAIAEPHGLREGRPSTWVVVPFANSFAPGPKTFDFDVSQVSYKPERAQTADLSTGYYFGNQSLVVLETSPLASATSIAAAQGLRVRRAGRHDELRRDHRGHRADQGGDGLRHERRGHQGTRRRDRSTASSSTCRPPTSSRTSRSRTATIVGQFDAGTPEYFGAVLAKDSPLTACVNAAIDSMTADGTLDTLASNWLPFQDTVPVFKP